MASWPMAASSFTSTKLAAEVTWASFVFVEENLENRVGRIVVHHEARPVVVTGRPVARLEKSGVEFVMRADFTGDQVRDMNQFQHFC